MRLIDADRLRNIALSNRDVEMVYEIDHSPTVERPHGEWIKFTLEGGFLSSHKCSKCGFNGNQLWHFCPSCGASMRVKDELNRVSCPSCGASMRVKDELNRVSKELNSEIEKSKSEIVPDFRDGWRMKEGEAE